MPKPPEVTFDSDAARLQTLIRASPWLMAALQAARTLSLPDWCIGAGAIRNLVWDAMHRRAPMAPQGSDVDLCYFDGRDITPERDAALLARLRQQWPEINWDVVNQAGVHTWLTNQGHSPMPFTSLSAAVASWPETATAVAVQLDSADQLHIIAPYGLQDLFQGLVRRSPACSQETFQKRIAEKQYPLRWPLRAIQCWTCIGFRYQHTL